MAHQPNCDEPACAVLPEDSILGAIEILVASPRLDPGCILSRRLELPLGLEVDPVAIVVIKLMAMQLGKYLGKRSLEVGHARP